MRLNTMQLLISLVFVVSFLADAQEEKEVTVEKLEQLPPLAEEFESLSYLERINYLTEHLEQAEGPADEYRLQRELAYQHYFYYETELTAQACQLHPPKDFDIFYRHLCVSVKDAEYEEKLAELIALHEDALELGGTEYATELLSEIGWIQSSNGHIGLAFNSFERALELAKDPAVNWPVLNTVMQNTATLYIMYGDKEYMENGVELHQQVLRRTKELMEEGQIDERMAQNTISLTYFNLGVANTLHLEDYDAALEWFDKVQSDDAGLLKSTLVFSALSAVLLGKNELGANFLDQSLQTTAPDEITARYLKCYQQLIQLKLKQTDSISACNNLHPDTQLEVKLDVYKRMSELEQDGLQFQGLKKFYALYLETLEPQLKQSASAVASSAELSRLKLESQLQDELLEKEQLLKEAESKRRETQTRLTYALASIFVLVIIFGLLQLRQKFRQAKRFEKLSKTDMLTGLNNRSYLEHNIRKYIDSAVLSNRSEDTKKVAIYLFDIDNFKMINDTYGHEVGDQVLVEFSRRVKSVRRESDILARWGGEEFLLVAKLDDLDDYHGLAERIRTVVSEEEFDLPSGLKVKVSCSVGGAIYPYSPYGDAGVHWNKLIQLADLAMYYGKQHGRNCWACIDEVTDPEQLETVLQQTLDDSLKQNSVKISSSIK